MTGRDPSRDKHSRRVPLRSSRSSKYRSGMRWPIRFSHPDKTVYSGRERQQTTQIADSTDSTDSRQQTADSTDSRQH
jgi:hypothetical protein